MPGVAAANNSPVTVLYSRPVGDTIQRVRRVEQDGFVVRTICAHCNSRTGGSYGTAYKDFVLQFARSGALHAGHQRLWISLTAVQPLRILKQMTAMFLAAQSDPNLEHWRPLREFVLRRDMKLPPGHLRYYLYRNASSTGRISSMNGAAFLFKRPRVPPLVASEISWPPLGIVFAGDAHLYLEKMKDITDWGERSFKDREDFGFSVPISVVESAWPVSFGTPREVEQWMDAEGVAWLVHLPPGSDSPTQIVALIKQQHGNP